MLPPIPSTVDRNDLRLLLFVLLHPHRVDSKAVHFMGSGPDAKEGVESFLEKRPPNFSLKVSEDLPDFYPWWDEPTFEP